MNLQMFGRVALLAAFVATPFAVRFARAACDQEQARSMPCPLAQTNCGSCTGGQGGLGGNCLSCTESSPATDNFGCKNNIGQQTNCNPQQKDGKTLTGLCNTMYGCRVMGNMCVRNSNNNLQPQNATLWQTDPCPGQE